MEFVKKIPVIGYLVRLVVAVIKLPKHLDRLYEMEAREEALRVKQEELVQWNRDRMEEIRHVGDMIGDLQQFRVGEDYIKKLNRVTSLYPTIWGDEEKLHLSNLSSVSSCMFNTNSGHITVGDYTFSGPGVSILAGSHDMQLTGLLRRDAELTEGCDIVIGDGVWLASNCTILGPATIGNHAVVAAGAVVTPGTVVPPYAIYGGVPAKQIGEVSSIDVRDRDALPIKKALERKDGVLFVEGWSEKKEVICNDKIYVGHFQIEDMAQIYFNKRNLKIFYQFQNVDDCTLKVRINDREEKSYHLFKSQGTIDIMMADVLQDEQNEIFFMTIMREKKEIELFVSVLEQ